MPLPLAQIQSLRAAALQLHETRARSSALFERVLRNITSDLAQKLVRPWQTYARPTQLRPKNCKPIWLRMCGRGEGKTRSACEERLDRMEDWGPRYSGILASKTIGDVRKVMIQGESGLEACARRRGYKLRYVKSEATVYHPAGGVAYMVTPERPDDARGLQSNDFWGDEISSWKNADETLDNILMGWRLPCPGGTPLGTITTSPKPRPIMYRFVKGDLASRTTVTGGRTRDNADNLAPSTLELLEGIYRGTKWGRQELDGELLDIVGALLEQSTIDHWRLRDVDRELITRRIVSLDPSITATEDSDAAGIVVCGSDNADHPHGYVLHDGTLETATFGQWARRTVELFDQFGCDAVIAELNQGGTGIVEAIQVAAEDYSRRIGREVVVPVRGVWAQRSKQVRAEPICALYESGRVHHVGIFDALEQELTTWMPGAPSPNRMDAMVHGMAYLLLGDRELNTIRGYLS